ncbi:MAG: hypothetical protein ISS36_02855 [Candidatus Aenigmarchaeota archaeon]|nr:hypothetical protein [Candidatus Aenigmarchaeota archaeon]
MNKNAIGIVAVMLVALTLISAVPNASAMDVMDYWALGIPQSFNIALSKSIDPGQTADKRIDPGQPRVDTGFHVWVEEKGKKEIWHITWSGIKGEENFFRGQIKAVNGSVLKMRTRYFDRATRDFADLSGNTVGFSTRTLGGQDGLVIKTTKGSTIQFHVTSTVEDMPIFVGRHTEPLDITADVDGFYNFELYVN